MSEILVIEDDPGFARILSALNRGWNLPLSIVTARRDIAAALAAPERFALVVSDCHVPGIDMLEALQALQAHRPEIAVVLMSSLDEEELRERGAALRPAHIEPKEHIIREPARFAETIRALLDRHVDGG